MADVDVIIKASTKEAQAAVSQFANTASKSLASVESAFGAIGKIAAVAVGFIAGRALFGALEGIAAEASAAEVSLNQMQVALKLAGDFSESASRGMEEFATQLQQTSIFSDDAILSQLALSKQFGVTNDEAKKLVKASADLASATGISLQEATQGLARTLDGTVGRFGETIPALKNLTAEQLKAGAAIDFVAGRFQGAANAAAQTFSGSITRTKNTFGDFLETLGGFITKNPVIIKAIGLLNDGFLALDKFVKQNQNSIAQFINQGLVFIASAVAPVITAVQKVISILAGLIKFLQLVQIGVRIVADAFLSFDVVANTIAGVTKVLGLATAGFLELIKIISQLPGVSTVLSEIGVDLNAVSDSVNGVNEKIFELTDSFTGKDIQAGSKKVTEGFIAATAATEGFFGSVNSGLDGVKAKANGVAVALKKAGDGAAAGIKAASDSIQNQIVAFKGISADELKKITSGISKAPLEIVFGLNKDVKSFFNEASGKLRDLEKQRQEAFAAGNSDLVSKFDIAIKQTKTVMQEAGLQFGIAAAAGVLELISKGAAGAKDAVVQVFSVVGDVLLPGFGSIIGQIANLLTAGPEAVKGFVEGFLNAIPQIIENIILAIPQLIISLAEGIPTVIQTFVDHVPQIIQKLIEALPRVVTALAFLMPRIAISFITALISQIPNLIAIFAQEMLKIPAQFGKALVDAIKGLVGGPVKAISGVVGKVGKFLGFAEGGLVPGGFPNDTFPARLTSNELVIDKSGTNQLLDFLDKNEGSPSLSDIVSELKDAIGQGGNASQNLSLNVVLSEREVAKALLNINRQGFRVTA